MSLRKQAASFVVLCAAIGTIFLVGAKTPEQPAEGDYYYSGGQKIPVVLDSSRVAVVFKKQVALDEVYSFLPQFRQFKVVPGLERQELARSNVFLIPLAEPLMRLNMQELKASLRQSNLVENVGKVYSVPKSKSYVILTEEIIVRFKPEITREQIDHFNADKKVQIVGTSKYMQNQFTLRITPESGADALATANQYYESGLTEFAHPNFIATFERRSTPNDLYYPNQWHLNNAGQEGGTVDADIDAPEAWDITSGDSKIRIAVLDDSIEIAHEDLKANIVASWDFTGDDDDPSPGPGDYHGTSVAGIVAGVGNNGKGVAGVAYGAKIVAVRLGDTLQDFADVFYWAAYTGNADVLSNSWGLTIPAPDAVRYAINDVTTNGRGAKGCVVLFAAGNSNSDISDPAAGELAALDTVIAVGASTNKDVRACFSSWGKDLDLVAPSNTWIAGVCPSPKPADAVGTWSTDQGGAGGFNDGTPPRPDAAGLYTQDFGGTSSACPTAAGIVGLLLSVNPDLTRTEVQEILQATAERIAPSEASYNGEGFSDHYGYGKVNAHRVVVPTVRISVEPKEVKKGNPFTVRVTGSAPFGLKSVWWFGDNTGIPDIDKAHWQNVSGAEKVFTHTWTATINEKGTYKLAANARDVQYPNPGDGYPHQASEGSGIATTQIRVVPVTPALGLLGLGLSFLLSGVRSFRRCRSV